jgi:hypothetical protein
MAGEHGGEAPALSASRVAVIVGYNAKDQAMICLAFHLPYFIFTFTILEIEITISIR